MVTLTQRVQQRLVVLNALERGELVMAEAAILVGLSVRQLRRLRHAYRRHGAKSLVHGNRGRPSPRRISSAIRNRVIRLAQTTYADINHRHLTELLAEREDLVLSHPTLHRILRAAGLRSPRRRRPPKHRQRRERMARAGMLIQMDGSHHAWLQDRGPALVLLHAIDDATGTVLGAVFREHEDAAGYLLLLRHVAATHGLPVAVYTDRHGIFVRSKPTPLTLQEQLRGGPDPTQVGRALHELGIRWIPASSPQAKGRIERLFATFQDRLRAELRLAHVRDRHDATCFLAGFLPRYNARFMHPAADPPSAYRPWPPTVDPDTIFCFKYRRVVANDHTVTLGPHQIQLLPAASGRSDAKLTVEVHERLDGSMAVYHQGRRLLSHIITPPAPERVPARKYPRAGLSDTGLRRGGRSLRGPRISSSRGEAATSPKAGPERLANPAKNPRVDPWKPAPDHPWRHMPVGKTKPLSPRSARTKSLNR